MQPTRMIGERNGLTLIEVVAGLALLSMLMVTAMVGFSRHKQQIEFSQDQLAAAELADQLLADWYKTPERFPRASSGLAHQGDRQFVWKTRVIYDEVAQSMFADKVRLTMEKSTAPDAKLVSVEILVARPIPPADTGSWRIP